MCKYTHGWSYKSPCSGLEEIALNKFGAKLCPFYYRCQQLMKKFCASRLIVSISVSCALFRVLMVNILVDGSFFDHPTDELPESSSVPKIRPIFGVVGMLKLLAGKTSFQTLKTCSCVF